MLAAVFAVLFGISLLPGRKPLCLRFADRVSGGILPDGARTYCHRLTWFWFVLLSLLALVNLVCAVWVRPCIGPRFGWAACAVPSVLSLAVIPLVFLVEKRVRDRRFSVVFHTSGSTGGPKTIVKTFESLAKEVARHRDFHLARLHAAGVDDPGRVLLVATIDPDHMFGALWRKLLPAAAGFQTDDEIVRAPEALLAKMRGAERVFLVTTPSFLDRFTAYAGQYEVPRNCVEIVTSGALLSKDVSERTKIVFGVEPRQIFGSTETGGVAWRRGDGEWQVLPDVEIRAETAEDGADHPRLAVRSPYSFRRSWYVMGDGVEVAPGNRSFRLFGRNDRLVKINEERVDLAEMEAKVRSLGYPDCALAVLSGAHGPYLGAVIVRPHPSDGGPPANPSALDLRRELLPVFPKGTVPKRFRLVHELPRNAQGKVPNAEIVRRLESALVEPIVVAFRCDGDELAATVVFDAEAVYFQGHFPAAPVLPGVAQLGFAERCAEYLRGRPGALKCVKKMKFVHVIEPGEKIGLRVVRRGEDEFAYEYKRGNLPCASGLLVF